MFNIDFLGWKTWALSRISFLMGIIYIFLISATHSVPLILVFLIYIFSPNRGSSMFSLFVSHDSRNCVLDFYRNLKSAKILRFSSFAMPCFMMVKPVFYNIFAALRLSMGCLGSFFYVRIRFIGEASFFSHDILGQLLNFVRFSPPQISFFSTNKFDSHFHSCVGSD